jgi:hypothetical protein
MRHSAIIAISNINHTYGREEVVYGLGAYNHRVPSNQRTTIELVFSSSERLNEFFDVITEQQQDEKLREKSPTLQKAWEEYQILLKLSK